MKIYIYEVCDNCGECIEQEVFLKKSQSHKTICVECPKCAHSIISKN